MNPPSRAARRLSALVVAIGLLSTTAGCSIFAPAMQRTDILGTWQVRDGEHTITLEMSGDGTLAVDDLPRALLDKARPAQIDWEDTLDATGTWSFPHAKAAIFVSLDDVGDSEHYSGFDVQPRAGELLTSYGDIDFPERLAFTLLEGPSTPAPATLVRQDLIGQWESSNGGSGPLTLASDNTFEITDLPAGLMTVGDPATTDGAAVDVTGRWSMYEEPLPLDDFAGPLLFNLSSTQNVDLADAAALTLREDDGELILLYRDGAAQWKLSSTAHR